MMPSTIPAHVDQCESDTREGRRLEYFTLGWNLTEAVVGIGAGVIAGSVALVGFGVDSIIESFSGASLLWRLQSRETGEKREQLALKLVGISFSYSQPISRLMPSRRWFSENQGGKPYCGNLRQTRSGYQTQSRDERDVGWLVFA
jgi:hypothetical protein